MSCNQVHFDVAVLEFTTLPSDEPVTVHLSKMAAMHIIYEDECLAPVKICVNRVVKCQKGCAFDTFLQDFPIDPSNPILPPGEYQICAAETYVPLFGGPVVGVDVIFEDVTPEYVQAVIANKNGGCS